ncbi:hypothetical protein C0216_11615 [Streptomyces globosus]|uniref:Uncharacterized protein n=1 Tax=Streptomyces globosus TaxID=68209 RepID=A0A344TZE8_9ACTN|nr:hypothetical protein [Streptomyces globosus]AXE24019.1 hypothetical protein C0216_11615 [Streptomyces globosus]
MSHTGHERPGRSGQEGPAQGAPAAEGREAAAPPPAPPAAGERVPDPSREGAGRVPGVPQPGDPVELLTDGVVELRKRGGLAARLSGPAEGRGPDAEDRLETVARQAAERVAAEGNPRV